MADENIPDDPTLPDAGGEEAETLADQHGPKASGAPSEPSASSPMGPQIPGYELTGPLGEGGMGTVWRATQLATKRDVALKLMGSATIGSPRARMRFEREVELSATLEHPNIARVYEAGEHRGITYYAMQMIDGPPLDEYVQGHGLDAEQTLRLMRSVCLAVQHAHARGVIHRDLKPSNVLVSSDGEPHVLDFGLAKMTLEGDDGKSHPTITREGDLAGTIAYMAPEQAAGRVREIDTRTDVYALGVILYRLLAMRHPYELKGRDLHESIRVVIEKEPSPLSTVDRSFRGDIETIVAKAMSKEPDRRYATAQALADDIGRYLDDEPIEARPASTWYQINKFARRNRILVGSAAAIVVALLLGVLGTGLGLVRALDAEQVAKENEADARRAAEAERTLRIQLEANEQRLIAARDRAQSERATAEAINRFIVQMFQQADPRQTGLDGQRDITVAQTLDRAAERLDSSFEEQPAIEASLRQVIGKTYLNLGYYEESDEQLRQSFEIRKRLIPSDDEAAAEQSLDAESMVQTYIDLAYTAFKLGEYDQSLELLEEALPYSIERLGPFHLTTLYVQSELARVLPELGRSGESDALYGRTLEALREHHEDHDRTINLIANLAMLRLRQGRLQEAEPLMREALEAYVASQGWTSPITLEVGNNLSVTLNNLSRVGEAAELAAKVLAYKREVLGENHPSTLTTACHLAWQRATLGDRDASIDRLLDLLARGRTHAGPTSLPVRFALDYLITLMPRADRSGELAALAEELVSTEPQWKDGSSLPVAALKNRIARAMTSGGKPNLAVPVLTGALDDLAKVESARSSLVRLNLLDSMAIALRTLRRTDELVDVNREQVQLLVETFGPRHEKTIYARTSLGVALCRSPDPALAAEAAEHLKRNFEIHRETLGPSHVTTLGTWVGMVQALAGANEPDRANAEIDAVVLDPDVADEVPPALVQIVPLLRALASAGSPAAITPAPLPKGSDQTLDQLRSKADALIGNNRFAEAGETLERYSRACVDELGVGHPSTLRAAIAVAENLHRQGDRDQARRLFIWIADRCRLTRAPQAIGQQAHRWLNDESGRLLREAQQYHAAGQFDEPPAVMRSLLHVATAMSGRPDGASLQSYNFLGIALIEAEQYEKAVATLTEATRVQRSLGPPAEAYLKIGELHLRTAKQRLEDKRN